MLSLLLEKVAQTVKRIRRLRRNADTCILTVSSKKPMCLGKISDNIRFRRLVSYRAGA